MIVEQSTCFAPQTSVEAYAERRRSVAGQASPQFVGAFTPQPACVIPLSPTGQQPQVSSGGNPHRYQRGFHNPAAVVAPYVPATRHFPDPTFQVGGMWYDNTFSSTAHQQQPYNGFTSAHTRYISTSAHNAAIHRKNATRESTSTLKTWLHEHSKNPYPTKGEKVMLAVVSKMTLTQVSTWFANARRRLKKENKMTWVPKHKPSDSSSQQTQPNEDCSITDDANESTLDADADVSSLPENPLTNITKISDIGPMMEYQGNSQRTITHFKPGSTDFCFPTSSNQQNKSAACLSAAGRSAFNASTPCQQEQAEFPSTLLGNPEAFAQSLPFASSCSSYQPNSTRLEPIQPQDTNFHFQSQQTHSRNYYDAIKQQEPLFQAAPTPTANHIDWPNNQSQFVSVYSTPISYADVGSRGNDRATSTGNCSETASEPAEFYYPKYEDSSPEPPPETTFAPTKSMWNESAGFPNNSLTTQLPVW